MTNAPDEPQTNISQKLATETPWVLIAVLLHVVVVAVASIMYYVHESSKDDLAPTEMSVQAPQKQEEDVKPPDIVDREEVPKLKDQDITPSDLTELNPDAEQDPEHGDPTDPNAVSELTNLPSGDTTGGSAIGVNGPGHFGIAPSATGGRKLGGGKYGSRFGHGKGAGGAGGRVNEAITLGLEWLRKHQDEDGKWDTDQFMKHDTEGSPCTGPGNAAHDVGITGLALLAFLGEGNTLRLGTYRKVVKDGTKWLIDQQDPQTGLIGALGPQGAMYSHAIATNALCETYGLSENYRPYKKFAQLALNYIAGARNPYGVWRYEPKANDGDSSITGWMVQALLSGKYFELDVDTSGIEQAKIFFDSLTDPATGAVGYQHPGEGSSRPTGKLAKFPNAKTEALTGVVLMCDYLMERNPAEVKTMKLAAETMMRKLPTWNPQDGSIDMYYWYYGSYAMFQAGEPYWGKWSKALTDAALKSQLRDGNAEYKNPNDKGSWDPIDAWGDEGGRVYSTAIMVLCLEAYYRYGKLSITK